MSTHEITLKERGAVRSEVTSASLIEEASDLIRRAIELGQIGAAVSALRG